MKKIVLYAAALLMLCGVTGCGKANASTQSTDQNSVQENVDSERAMEDTNSPVEIDVFEGSEIIINRSDYPNSVSFEIQGQYVSSGLVKINSSDEDIEVDSDNENTFTGVKAGCSIVSATPEKMIIKASIDENAAAFSDHNYIPKEVEKDYEISVSTLNHALLRNDEITEDVENKLIDGMIEDVTETIKSSASMANYLTGEDVQVPDMTPVALYTLLPPPDQEFIEKPLTSSIGVYDIDANGYGDYGVYGILTDQQGTYYALYTNVAVSQDGAIDLGSYRYLVDESFSSEFNTLESAYACIERDYQQKTDDDSLNELVLTEFKTYTDQATAQPETTEITTSEE